MTTASQTETRTVLAPLVDVEWRQSGNGEDFTLTGHAAVFDSWSEELSTRAGSFREKIAPGAFQDVLGRTPDVRLLYNHDGLTLARTKSGTLELEEDDAGLRVWAQLADTSIARDLRLAMKRGDIDQMSFAFTVADDGDEWREDEDTGETERTITNFSGLYDVSVVSFPAYPDTDAAMREIRSAAERAGITLVAPAETDPVGEQSPPDPAEPETDAQEDAEGDDTAPAEPDPEDVGKAEDAERAQALSAIKESQIRLRKEIARWEN